jgi:hypothetical protein
MYMKETKSAKDEWEKIPSEVKMKLLNNVYCVSCKKMVNINIEEMKTDKFGLVLKGTCMNCHGPVARVIERE